MRHDAGSKCEVVCGALAGEIPEFKQELNSLDRGKKKDAVKKVIAGGSLIASSSLEGLDLS